MNDYRPPYWSAVVAGGGIFLLYVLTLSPSTAMWDASEYIATAHILGIPHPPGNPLFVVLGRAWSLLLSPLGLSVAVRINLLAAFTSAAAAGFYFLVTHRILWGIMEKGEGGPTDARKSSRNSLPLMGAALAVLLSGTAFTVWNQSNVNEKVYTVSVLVIATVVWLAFRWRDRRDEPQGLRYLLWAVYLLALGSTNHLMSVLPLPALGLFILLVSPAVLLNKDLWIRAVPLVILGLSFNFFLPIRAAEDPVINEGDPACESLASAAVAVYTNGKAGCDNLSRVLTRFQYRKPPLSERQATFGAQLQNYYQYFEWQWGRGLDPAPQPGGGRTPVALLFMALGFWGLWVLWKGDRGGFFLLGGLILTCTLGLVFYLNFKYGYSLAPHIRDQSLHEVRERDYFFIASFGLWGLLAGLGLTAVWQRLAGELRSSRALLFSSPVLLVAFIPLATNWQWASRAGDYSTRDWAYNLLMSVEPYGVIFTNGDNDTFPLWYVQEVEGIRQDVTVVVGQYLYTPWYPRQLQNLTSPERQRPYDPELSPALYETPEPPSNPIITLGPEQMDAIQGGQSSGEMSLPLGEVVIQYPAGTYLDRGDQLTLAMIFSSVGERPIYFATPSGILGSLGLEPWSVRHGLAAKLIPRNLDEPQPEHFIQTSPAVGGDWFDVRRSLTLMEDVYSYRGFENREVWTDRSTLNIPWYFYATAVQLADAVSQWEEGSQEQVSWLQQKAEAFSVTAQGGRLAASPAGEG
ncbi:MAG: DUF2723 domain-containing protein [Longimicrobiales bacterium]